MQMLNIKFRYRDAMSNWEWRTQSCTVSSVEECKRIYGLDNGCWIRDFRSQRSIIQRIIRQTQTNVSVLFVGKENAKWLHGIILEARTTKMHAQDSVNHIMEKRFGARKWGWAICI